MKYKLTKETIFSSFVVVLGLAFVYYFTTIFVYMIIAAVIGLVGGPLKALLMKIEIKGKSLPNAIASSIIMLFLMGIFLAIFIVLIPSIANQADDLAKLDYQKISHNLDSSFDSVEGLLKDYGILSGDKTMEELIHTNLKSFVADIRFNQMATNAVSIIGGLVMGIFSVLFFSFFFIKDSDLFRNIFLLFVPVNKKENFSNILNKISKLLSRYFVGLMTEVGSMMILESIGGLILGLPNALLIGFLGGLLNIIPYIGPLIGAAVASLLVIISHISMGMDATLPLVYGILAVFAIANMIDNFLLQPIIYSKSVQAHPLEIFIVIIVGGSLFGTVGMILAIPVYTIIRVIAKEFFQDQAFVYSITKDL